MAMTIGVFNDNGYYQTGALDSVLLTVNGGTLTLQGGLSVGGGKSSLPFNDDVISFGSEGTLRIENGGIVKVGGAMIVGGAQEDDYSGYLILDGGTLETTQAFTCGSSTVMGTMTLSNGAVWNGSGTATFGTQSSLAVGSGSVVNNAGSMRLNNGASLDGKNSALNLTGNGSSLLVLGGTFSATNGAEVSVAGDLSCTSPVLVDAATMTVGGKVTAEALTMQNGSALRGYELFTEELVLQDSTLELTAGGGINAGGTGTVKNATWTMGGALQVGQGATLTIGEGAKVTSDSAGSTIRGSVTVVGSGAEWTHKNGTIYLSEQLGAAGDGSLTIGNGGVVRLVSSAGYGSVNVSSGHNKGTLHVQQGGTLIVDYINASSGTAEVRIEGNLQARWIQVGRSGGEGTKQVVFDGGHWKVATGGLAKYDIIEGRVSAESGGFDAGEIVLASGGLTVETEAGFAAEISAILVGAGGITKTGAGDLLLSGENQFTGALVVSGGKLILNGNAVNQLVTIAVSGEGILQVDGAISISGLIVDGNKIAAGKYDLSANALAEYGITGIGSVTIIPEPSTYALLGGVLALGLATARRRKKA